MDHNIKILIGIDVSKNKQDICIKNNNGKVLKRLEIMGTREAQCALPIFGSMCYQAYKRQDTANGILGVGSAHSIVETG